jgi:hypothetical protein
MPKRMIDTNMWIDGQVVDEFTKNDILLWLYLLTSPHTNICGVLKCSISMIAFESKLIKKEIIESLENLKTKHHLIKQNLEEEEILILNWHKHNWSKSSKLLTSIQTSMETIKTQEFKNYVSGLIERYKTLI